LRKGTFLLGQRRGHFYFALTTCQCKSEDVRPRACDTGASRRMGTVIFLPGLSSQTAEQTPRQTRTYAIRGRLSAGVRRAAADARDATGVAREVIDASSARHDGKPRMSAADFRAKAARTATPTRIPRRSRD